MSIDAIGTGLGPATRPAVSAGEAAGDGFATAFQRVIEEANQHQIDAHKAVSDLVLRGEGTVHDAMIAVQTAEGSFRLLMEMRNRLVDGVNRLLQTQV